MRFKLLCICLIFVCCNGCVAAKSQVAESAGAMISLPEARERVVVYYESGKYENVVEQSTEAVAQTAIKAIGEKVKFPAVVMVVEDVLLSTYKARKKQDFSGNAAAKTDLENHVILSALPPIKPSVELMDT